MSDSPASWERIVSDAAHAARGQYAAALPALGMVVDGLLGDVPAAQREALRTAEQALDRAAVVAADLVTLAGTALAAGRPEPGPFPVPRLLVRAEELCRKGGVRPPRLEIEAALPHIVIDERLYAAVLCILIGRATPRAGIGIPGEEAPARIVAAVAQTVPEGGTADDRGRQAAAAAATSEWVVLRVGAADESAEWTWEAEDERDAALVLCRGIVEAGGGRLFGAGGGPLARTGGGTLLEAGGGLLKNERALPSFRLQLPARRAGDR